MTRVHPTAVFSLNSEALSHNLKVIRERSGSAQIIAMVKANAYGHGMIGVVKKCAALGVDSFGVVTIDEALELRNNFKKYKIFLWAGAYPEIFKEIVEHQLTPVLHNYELWIKWCSWSRKQKIEAYPVHLEVNTGIGRTGLSLSEFDTLMDEGLPAWIKLESLAMHYFDSENPTGSLPEQRALAIQCLHKMHSKTKLHCANSAAILNGQVAAPEAWVRPGIMLYGYNLEKQWDDVLKPIGHFKACIIDLKKIYKGEGVSYNHSFIAAKDTHVATLGVGYADGVPRSLANQVEVEVGSFKVPMIGNICMDVCCLDVTSCGDQVQVGDWVTLFGPNREALQWASSSQTIVYEILCHLGNRVQRKWKET